MNTALTNNRTRNSIWNGNFDELFSKMDDRFFSSSLINKVHQHGHLLDEDDNSYTYHFDVAGFDKDWLEVYVDQSKGTINISGTTPDSSPLNRTISYQMALPENVNMDSIESEMSNGILYMTIDKESEKETSTRKRISIK